MLVKKPRNAIELDESAPRPLHPEGSLVEVRTPHQPEVDGLVGIVRATRVNLRGGLDYIVEFSPGKRETFLGRELRRKK